VKTPKQINPVVILSTLFLAIAILISSCSDRGSGPAPNLSELRRVASDMTTEERLLCRSVNEFGLELFKKILAQEPSDKNVFVSPLSISTTLAMTLNGANGNTREEIQSTLNLEGMSRQQINESCASLIRLMTNLDSGLTLTLANSIWYREDLQVVERFARDNQEYFNAQVSGLDFSQRSAASTINSWVSEKTNGLVEGIVTPPISDSLLVLVVNAIYFKALWTHPFDPNLTHPSDFHVTTAQKVSCPMMVAEQRVFGYLDEDGSKACAMPYANEEFLAAIIVPDSGLELGEIVDSLTSEVWQNYVHSFEQTEMWIVMPKFSFEYENDLKGELAALGIVDAFDRSAADFSRMVNLTVSPVQPRISKVKHKTFVTLNEYGTEAAGVTSVEAVDDMEKPGIRANRPFLFVIYEKETGTILFMGRVSDPTQS